MAAFCAAALSVDRTLRQPASKPSIAIDSAASGPQSVIGGFRTAAIANGTSAKYRGVIRIGPTIEVLAVQTIKYRLFEPRLAPRRTKLEVPGWGGNSEPRSDGSHEQAWHCMPFNEGAQYGIELFYPYDNELHVSTRNGQLHLEGDWGEPPDSGVQWPPFRNFGGAFYTYQLLLDLKVPKGFAIRTEPHPRFYSDPTDTVYPSAFARSRTRFQTPRGHAGCGAPSSRTKSMRNDAVSGSHGRTRKVDGSMRACVSGYPVCQPVWQAVTAGHCTTSVQVGPQTLPSGSV